jgi:ElaB/YqjD/DUF883 family membrane-anchored ribosome-binding protein
MAHHYQQSVAELRRESERTRAELSQTVENLRTKITDTAADIRHKVSPEHIKAEVSDYVTEKGRGWLETLKQQALDNPLQTLAAGTAVAVPAFKIIRSVPLPLLMIGAGLALASPRIRGAVADKASDTLRTPDGGNVVDESARFARDQWQSAKNRAEGAIEEARSSVTAAAADVRETTEHVANSARQQAAELSDAARQTVTSASEGLSAKVNTASESVKDAFETTKAKAAETFNETRASAENVVRDNPVWVGGLGLAIGALIAASLPSTRAEQATLGETSETLRRKAAEAASEKFDEVKTAAMSATESAAEKISEAGIASKMSRAADDAAEKLKTVTEDTITTAFEPSQADHR